MSGAVRTIRALDRRPGEPDREVKTVAGIPIERGVPISAPRTGSKVVQALLALEVGESFTYGPTVKTSVHSKNVRASGRRFTLRRISDATFRVWRTS
jgi:hypothetical protein